MRLRNIDFGPVFGASGVQGFFGEGYLHHKFLRFLGLNFDGCTFVAKTTIKPITKRLLNQLSFNLK